MGDLVTPVSLASSVWLMVGHQAYENRGPLGLPPL